MRPSLGQGVGGSDYAVPAVDGSICICARQSQLLLEHGADARVAASESSVGCAWLRRPTCCVDARSEPGRSSGVEWVTRLDERVKSISVKDFCPQVDVVGCGVRAGAKEVLEVGQTVCTSKCGGSKGKCADIHRCGQRTHASERRPAAFRAPAVAPSRIRRGRAGSVRRYQARAAPGRRGRTTCIRQCRIRC